MWYENPAYALSISIISLIIGLAVGIIGLTVGIYTYRNSKRTTRANVAQRLLQRQTEINEAFLRHGVKGPYAHHLGIPDERVQQFTAKAVMVLHHLTLLQDVFEHRDILGYAEVAKNEKFAIDIVRPWIEADDELRKILQYSRQSEDLSGEDFLGWMDKLFPVQD